VDILVPVLVIGLVTFGLSFLGVLAGRTFGALLAGKMDILGGLILIAIGGRILLQHLRGG
jgi:putative Mn2+ efflux pump MntP